MRFLLLSSLLLTTPLLAQRIAEIEPNDAPGTAQPVAVGVQIDGTLPAIADIDYYSFVTVGGQVRITVSGTLDTRLEVTDGAGAVILAGNDDSRGLESDVTINLAPGAYMAKVFPYPTTTTFGAYSLDIALETAPKPYTQAEAEPNDTVATANVLVPVANSVQLSGNLSGGADVDFYQLVLTDPKTGLFFQVTEGDAPWTSQHRIEFYDAAGVLLLAPLGTNAVDSGTFNFRTATTRVWPAGTYNIAIKNRVGVLTYNPVPFGNYRLEIGIMPMNFGPVVPEGPEPNNTIATATPLPAGGQGLGFVTNLAGADPSDLWGPIVVGPTGSVLTFQTANVPVGTMLDTTIKIYQVAYPATVPPSLLLALTATTGNVLETAAGSSHARAVVTFFVPGFTYYVAVESPGATAAQTGNYALEISTNEPAMYVASSYAIVAANGTCGVAPFPALTRNLPGPPFTTITNESPTVGQTFSRQATGITSTLGLLIQGLDNIAPLDIFPFGLAAAPATCFLNVSPLVISTILAPTGTAELTMTIPPTVALRGFIMWEQVAHIPSFAPFTLQMSNYARILIGERSY